MSHGEAGKGDRTRPFDQKKWSDGYDRAFGEKPTGREVTLENDEKPKGEHNVRTRNTNAEQR